MTIYLDHNATTEPAPEVVEAMTTALRVHWANPSSIHRPGQSVHHQVELAREEIAGLIGASGREIVLTSGGTEADNLALLGSLEAQPGRRMIVTNKMEHTAVRDTALHLETKGVDVQWIGADAHGIIDLDGLRDRLARSADEIAVVSVMWGNNETGVVQPIDEIGAICREHGVRLHVDAVQYVGKRTVDLGALPVDLLSLSAHKFHGPKGIGALYVRRGVRVARQMTGGPHERERRGGTENVPGIIGMAMAARLARAWLETSEAARLESLRDRFERSVVEADPGAVVNGVGAPRLWNTSNIGFPKLEAEALLLMLSERGVCAAAGAACASGSLDPSPVLLAMGVPNAVAHGSVRFSLGKTTTDAEIDEAIGVVREVVQRLRASLTVV